MFDIGWSEIMVIAVVALIAIGPKELPGVLRMVGQWMGKARKMAAEFQGQFQEAMREAEMADLKKSFDEVKEAASGFTSGGLMTSLQKDVSDALRVDALDKPAERPAATAVVEPPATPTTPEAPTPETFVEAEAHSAVNEPLAIISEVEHTPVAQDGVAQDSVAHDSVTRDTIAQDTAPSEAVKDAKAS